MRRDVVNAAARTCSALAVLAVALIGGPGLLPTLAPAQAETVSQSSNKAAASADATALLGEIRLPAGASASESEPAGDSNRARATGNPTRMVEPR